MNERDQLPRALSEDLVLFGHMSPPWARRKRKNWKLKWTSWSPLAPQRVWLLARLEAAPDVTLRASVVELGERSVMTS
jgi:hypothetical protein